MQNNFIILSDRGRSGSSSLLHLHRPTASASSCSSCPPTHPMRFFCFSLFTCNRGVRIRFTTMSTVFRWRYVRDAVLGREVMTWSRKFSRVTSSSSSISVLALSPLLRVCIVFSHPSADSHLHHRHRWCVCCILTTFNARS